MNSLVTACLIGPIYGSLLGNQNQFAVSAGQLHVGRRLHSQQGSPPLSLAMTQQGNRIKQCHWLNERVM